MALLRGGRMVFGSLGWVFQDHLTLAVIPGTFGGFVFIWQLALPPVGWFGFGVLGWYRGTHRRGLFLSFGFS